MATFPALKAAGPAFAMAGVGDGQSAKVMTCTYSWSTALLIADIIATPLIQKGSVITDVTIVTDSMGSGAVTLDVGYGDDPDYFIAASNIGVAGGVARMSAATAKPLTLTVNDSIDVTIKVAPTGATASGTIAINVTYLPLNT